MVLYQSNETAVDRMASASPEEMKKNMEPWMEWAKKCGDKLVDMGKPLGYGKRLTKSGSGESTSNSNGYSILKANDMDEAISLIASHPYLSVEDGAAIEVFEMLPIPGMD